MEARARVQLLAEMTVGVKVRAFERAEDDQFIRLKESTLGAR